MKAEKHIGWTLSIAAMLLLAACGGNEGKPEQTAGGADLGGAATAPNATAPAAQTASPEASPAASAPAVTAPASAAPGAEPSSSATQTAKPTAAAPGSGTETAPEEGVPPTALEAASTVVRALKNKDMDQLAAWTHADKGVRFSPYGYVDTKRDQVFKREEIEGLLKDKQQRVWGEFAGKGDEIKMTYAEYHDRFVYDADFETKAEIGLNQTLGQGTTLNNLQEVYPPETYDFVEYYIDGVDPDAQGMDWRSLRLVFEKIGEDRALVGIVHDQWTP